MTIRKTIRIAACLAAISLTGPLTSCSSDPNPVDYIQFGKGEATIQLNLSVAGTRADSDPNATVEEQKVTKVTVYIFDSAGKLESTHADLTVTDNKLTEKINTTSGLKTIYVVSAKSTIENIQDKVTTISDFENALFNSTESNLKTADGFVMIGKTDPKNVVKSATAETMPSANTFEVTLERSAAKVQVKYPSLEDLYAGFSIITPKFAVRQTADKMRVVPNESDVLSSYVDTNNDFTYDGYTYGSNELADDYFDAVEAFKASGCAYVSENIVGSPVSGNTTFISVCIPMYPQSTYTYSVGATTPAKAAIGSYSSGQSYYVVGRIDGTSGFADYIVDNTSKNVICFHNIDDANRYMEALNGGTAQAMTVSETEEPIKSEKSLMSTRSNDIYQTFEFVEGKAYFRINIAHTEKDGSKTYKVCRNNFYKIAINSIKTLGFPSEDYLRPTNPETSLEITPSTWLDATFIVAPWNNVDQSVDL